MQVRQGSPIRDNQRKRVYRSEREAREHFGHNEYSGPFLSMAEAQAEVTAITQSMWWRRRFRSREYKLTDGRGTRNGFNASWYINLPRWTRRCGRWVILHELAHGLVPGGAAWHGPEFAKVYLALVEQFIGKTEAAYLRERYKVNRVRYRCAWTFPVRFQPKSTATLAAEHRARELRPLSTSEKSGAAETLRRGVKTGMFGPSGTKTRTAALAVARTLEQA